VCATDIGQHCSAGRQLSSTAVQQYNKAKSPLHIETVAGAAAGVVLSVSMHMHRMSWSTGIPTSAGSVLMVLMVQTVILGVYSSAAAARAC